MTQKTPSILSVIRKQDTKLVSANSESFAAFDQWMDVQLDLLVAQWIHTAAPNASRVERNQRRLSR